jgi:hypothetical protein
MGFAIMWKAGRWLAGMGENTCNLVGSKKRIKVCKKRSIPKEPGGDFFQEKIMISDISYF